MLYSYNPYKAFSMLFLNDFYASPSSNEPGPDNYYYSPHPDGAVGLLLEESSTEDRTT